MPDPHPATSCIQTIRKRISVRSYCGRLLDEGKESVKRILRENGKGPFDNPVRLAFIDLTEIDTRYIKKLGTYGFIQGADCYFAGAVVPQERAFEDFGYCFEKAILDLTAQGYGTCWMAATFNRQEFARQISLRENEVMPAISPVGYPTVKRIFFEKFLWFLAKSRKRKAWDQLFFDGSFDKPLTAQAAGRYAEPLECVRWAPSGTNMQSWRIVKDSAGNAFHFYARKNPSASLIKIHTGIAMCHFELAAKELGLAGEWTVAQNVSASDQAVYMISWREAQRLAGNMVSP
jgi:hypothetical protein